MAVSSLTEPSFASRQEEVMLLNFSHGRVKSCPSFPESRSPRAVRTAEKIARVLSAWYGTLRHRAAPRPRQSKPHSPEQGNPDTGE